MYLIHLIGFGFFSKVRATTQDLFQTSVFTWPVTGQGFQNTKWPAVIYSQEISQNRKIVANLN